MPSQTLAFGVCATSFLAGTVWSAQRLVKAQRLLGRTVRAEGTCGRGTQVRSAAAPRTALAHPRLIAFSTADGSTVEFEDPALWTVAQGTRVTVAYEPHGPRSTARVLGTGRHSPVRQFRSVLGCCALGAAGGTTLFLLRLQGGG